MVNWKNSKIMFWTIWFLAVALLIYILQQIEFILNPLLAILTSLFMPLLIAGFLFYLLNPIVRVLEKIKVKRIFGVSLVMVFLVGIVVLTLFLGLPILVEQTSSLIAGIPDFVNELDFYFRQLGDEPWMNQVDFDEIIVSIDTWLRNLGSNFLGGMLTSVGSFLQSLTDFFFTFITVPVILFYMLYDGHRFPGYLEKISPEPYKKNTKELVLKINETIASYISGKGMASLLVGIILFIMYTIAGFPFALLLSVFAAITNFIPYVGPFLGAGPAILVGMIDSPGKALLAAVFVLIVQQLDGNLFTPFLVGKSLSVHPLTVILILLASANIAGLLGMLIGVPVFAIIKTIVLYIIKVKKEKKITLT
ncbi:AI-2E family transporter [Marinilactibacillus kalidii]|uniref:AI-2E family transporter n=1 Tax=Marinilactibacillus kalidii TaxID=2820274 RepID=UPI001ABDAFF2|nr:AI-2E family transporter [Marinilactibacillus kalidii]